MTSTVDIAWAAGFMEGEGSFMQSRTTPYLECAQVQREPLERMQAMFGGTVSLFKRKNKGPSGKWNDFYRWTLYGNAAAGLMMTFFVLMSPKRKDQIEKVLLAWKARRYGSHHSSMTECKAGHPYAEGSWTPKGANGRQCKVCMNAYRKAYAQRQLSRAI